ncbi:carbohydrate sulfotransferase 9-like isoform X2 [Engystomops pustulosus]|uniref:carbohydrate sulfotransferase 9-like isoform X2 n=1 Tax=Engystomops pustulosus TaxID=76066 RepID=UPI003AFA039D
MRRVTQKIFLLIVISGLFAFFLHNQWSKHHFALNGSQYSPLASQAHRKATIRSVCDEHNLTRTSYVLDRKVAAQLYVEHSHKFLYCEVPKVGCSNWKRIILLLNDSLGHTPGDLKHYQVHGSKQLKQLGAYPPEVQKQLLANYTKVMFTRDPLERVVSAYRDKFLHVDDVYYSKTIANQIKRTLGIDPKLNLTFEQFAQFIIQENASHRDTHWKPMYELCDPCSIKYDFIGKFTTITEDADYVLKIIGAHENLKFPTMKHHSNDSRTGKDLTIRYLDTISPVLFRKLMNVYSLDFSMFDYSNYNSTYSKVPKTEAS